MALSQSVIKLITTVFIVFHPNLFFGQLNIPIRSLPMKVLFRICPSDKTSSKLYATVFTDTLKKYRLWLFQDTAKMKDEYESILWERLDTFNNIRKQIFLSKPPLTPKKNWQQIDFLDNNIYSMSPEIIESLKGEWQEYNIHLSPQLDSFFRSNLVSTVRYANYTRYNQWNGALQVAWMGKNFEMDNWMPFLTYYKQDDILYIKQEWTLFHDYFEHTRMIVKKRLINMEYKEYSHTYFRQFIYDPITEKLMSIIEGEYVDDTHRKNNAIIYPFSISE